MLKVIEKIGIGLAVLCFCGGHVALYGNGEWMQRLHFPNRMERSAAALEVGRMANPDPALVERLKKLLDDDQEVVRTSAASALLMLGERDIFIDRLQQVPSHRARMEALVALRANLAGLKDPELRKAAEQLQEEAVLLIDPPVVNSGPDDPVQDGTFSRPDFENDWIVEYRGDGSGVVMYDEVEGRTEPGSLLIEHDSPKGEILLRSRRPLKVKGGEKSRPVRFYYRAEGASSGTIMQLFFEDETGERWISNPNKPKVVSYTASSQTFVRNTPDGVWNKRLSEIPESDVDKEYTLVISILGNPATIWIDDFAAPAADYGYWWPAGTISLEEKWEDDSSEAVSEPVDARVVKVGNQPRLVVNGEAIPPIMYLTQRSNMGDYAGVEQIGGVRIIVPSIPMSDLHDPRFEPRPPVWRGGLDFDFETILKDIDRAANDARDSYLILNLCFYWPADWAENNPDEVWTDVNGRWGYGTQLFFMGFGKELPSASNYRWWPSPSSQKALEDAAVGIRKLVEALREKPYFNRIIGCHISGGHDQQMFTGHWMDYSKPAQRAFREWLRERYRSDAGLQKAWNDPSVTFDTVKIPDIRNLKEKKRGGAFFLNPPEDQRYVDPAEFQAERGMVIRQTLAEVFREAMGRDVVAMTWQIRGGRGQGTERLFLKSPALDMMVTQPTYSVRLPGIPGGLRSMLGSMAYHGKLSIMELDLRTWLRPGGDELFAMNLGAALTPYMFRSIIRREAAQMMSRGHGFWLYDIVPLHYRDPVIYEEVAEVVRAYKEFWSLKMKNRSERMWRWHGVIILTTGFRMGHRACRYLAGLISIHLPI